MLYIGLSDQMNLYYNIGPDYWAISPIPSGFLSSFAFLIEGSSQNWLLQVRLIGSFQYCSFPFSDGREIHF